MRVQNDVNSDNRRNSALYCLISIMRLNGYPVNIDAFLRYGYPFFVDKGVQDIIRLARHLGVKARAVEGRNCINIDAKILPAIAARIDRSSFFIIVRLDDDGVLIVDGCSKRPEKLTHEELALIWDGTLVLLKGHTSLGSPDKRFNFNWFINAIGKYRNVLVEVFISSFILNVFGLATPLFFQVIVDKVLIHNDIPTLDVVTIGLMALYVFEAILTTLRNYIFSHTTNRIDVELGGKLFSHLVALPLGYFVSKRVGDSVARVRELENIRQFLTSSSLTIVVDLIFTLIFFVIMFWYSIDLTLIVLFSVPIYVTMSILTTPYFRQRINDRFKKGAENQAFLVEVIGGIETVKAMAIEQQMQARWEEQLALFVTSSFRAANLGNLSSQGIQLISKLVTGAVLFFGAKAVMSGNLSVGGLIAFNMFATRVSQPVLRLAQVWQDFHQARLSIFRMGDILNTPIEPKSSFTRGVFPPIKGRIQFEHVGFRYRLDGLPVLNDLNLMVEPGQVVGIVGPSGSGKSTVAKLLQRLHVPETGRVLIDGVDLRTVDTVWLRRQVGVVLQESLLFNRTVRENICVIDPGMPLAIAIEAAKLAGAHEFILQLPEGYDTVVGERGAALSGGQRQRIAIARALVGNPRILIFDEATSALDYESEQAIQTNMRRICAGRTVIIIAHRLSTVRGANRIVTIEGGRVVEDGTHEELLKRGGRYAALHRIQLGVVS